MKVQGMLLGSAIALLAFSAPVFAQRRIEVQPIQLQPKLIGGGILGEVPLMTPDAVEKLKFTNEQKDKYGKIEAEYKENNKKAQDAYRAAIMGVRDREKFKEAQDKLQTESKKAREDSLAKVEPILTGEQKTVFAQVKGQQPQPGPGGIRPGGGIGGFGGGIGQVLPPAVQTRLQLTDEQKKQIEAIQKEVEAKIMKVLTDEQKRQLETMKKGVIIRPIQPLQPNPRIQIQPAVPNIQPAPAVKRD